MYVRLHEFVRVRVLARLNAFQCVAACCSVLQYVVVCCNVLQCARASECLSEVTHMHRNRCVAVCCTEIGVLQCVAQK